MIKITIEVSTDVGQFLVAVCAESIVQAVKRVENRYGGESSRVVFPLNPDMFFVNDPDVGVCMEELEFKGQLSEFQKAV